MPILILRPSIATTPVTERVPSNQLGRGSWSAKLYATGGSPMLGELSFSQVSIERTRGATASEASITIPGGALCMPIVAAARDWEHELHVYRNAARVWLGPIRTIDFPTNGDAVITASDVTRWPQKAVLPGTTWYSDDVASIYAQLVELGIPAAVSARVWFAPVGVDATKLYYASGVVKKIDVLLNDLANAGVKATAVGRDVYVAALPPLDQPVRLLDSHFGATPAVKVDGDSHVNVWHVAGGQSSDTSDPVLVVVRDEGDILLSGELHDVDRDATITTDAAAAARGAANLARSAPAPVVFSGGVLDPSAPVTFDELVPGTPIGVTLSKTAAPVAGTYELTRVTASATPSSETITIEVQPSA